MEPFHPGEKLRFGASRQTVHLVRRYDVKLPLVQVSRRPSFVQFLAFDVLNRSKVDRPKDGRACASLRPGHPISFELEPARLPSA